MGQELTTANKILVSASQIAETQETFTAEDLIVRAWKEFPESFGLSGYREMYPDSNRVLSKLMGSVGLCSRGWLEQVSTKTYRMTVAGRKLAHALRTNDVTPAAPDTSERPRVAAAPARAEKPEKAERPVTQETPKAARARETADVRPIATAKSAERQVAAAAVAPVRPAPMPAVAPTASAKTVDRVAAPAVAAASATASTRAAPPGPAPVPARPPVAAPVVRNAPGASNFEGLHILQRLATSIASQKFSRGGLVTFQDACQFWAITPAIHPSHLAPRLSEIEALLKRAELFIQHSSASIRVHDRLEITMTTVIGLQGLHRMLAQRYHRELENIRGRASNNDAGEN